MLKIAFLIALGGLCALHTKGSVYDPNRPPNDYRSAANPYYWKNRKPHAAYWQQDLYYRITAFVDEQTHTIRGRQWLIYWNNSPDTLYEVFFHLYQQAFVKGGHLEALNRANWFKQRFGPYEAAGKGCLLDTVAVEGQLMQWEQDFSVMRLPLPRPLPPNDSLTFYMSFRTYFDSGTQRRRMKKFSVNGYTHYDGVHWYPRICVYDARMGWDTDQHLGKEFYGNFGTYDVQLSFAANYVVGATGTLLNEEEVLPRELRQKLDLKNFAAKPWNSTASTIIPYEPQKRKTWHFYAENVHDFAFTADPTYRIDETYVTIYDPFLGKNRTVLCQALAQESHAAYWQDAAAFAAQLIYIYSRDFGPYLWPKIIVADAADGMEYPMVTLDGGRSPGYFGLLAHEVGHMWFYGHVANNETYRAFLDEGFTQFLESWAMRKIFGDTLPTLPATNGYVRRYRQPLIQQHQRVYHPYLSEAINGTDEPINQHSDGFNSALGHGGGYRLVYFKTATMLYNLQYVLGDSLFQKVMKHYFHKWMLCHPYPEDFRAAVTEIVGMDLNWFFDQWLETTKKQDYAILSVRRLKSDSAYVAQTSTSSASMKIPCNRNTDCYLIRLQRKGRMQSSLDVTVLSRNHTPYSFHIPNTWFIKSTRATVLPRWYGWDKLHPYYEMKVHIPGGLSKVMIDPTKRMADIYMPNNEWPRRLEIRPDYLLNQPPNWTTYQLYARPDLWYNSIDGLKVGVFMSGNYMEIKNVFSFSLLASTSWGARPFKACSETQSQISCLPEGGCRLMPLFADFTYRTVLPRLGGGVTYLASVRAGEGLWRIRTALSWPQRNVALWSWAYEWQFRPAQNACYMIQPCSWSYEQINSFIKISYKRSFKYFTGYGWWQLTLRTPLLVADTAAYSYAAGEAFNQWQAGKTQVRLRAYVRAGTPNFGTRQSLLFAAGASPEEYMDHRFYRSRGWFPQTWHCPDPASLVQTHLGGGLNIRALSFLSFEAAGNPAGLLPFSTSGSALNLEWDFSNLMRLQPSVTQQWLRIDAYLFAEAGFMADAPSEGIWKKPIKFSPLLADAGIGVSFTIRRWFMFDKLEPLTIRADFPLWVTPALPANTSAFHFRCLIGIGRSF
ncbi:MAG: M1 family metallopeptidase [Chitinophagales bacterium]|nr:M1 family metallopeptidase [Chitinophagales bacterium]MDW8428485.1 M1 family metallopeptidase [Chitinophagales bacterium]